ncbi:MAG: glutamyl-tRNA reductase [Ilumatobacteraceae bacterium]
MDAGSLALVAITHQQTPLEILERVNLTAERADSLGHRLLGHVGVSESLVISTCNRTELYLFGSAPNTKFALRTLAAHTGVSLDALRACAVSASSDEAAHHLLRVAAGLESRVAGEIEILGQIRSAIAAARASGSAGPCLTNLFRFAIAAGRQAQHAADDALTPSLPRLALDVADPFQPVGAVLVLGSGTMAGKTVEELNARRLDYTVCARRHDRALRLAGADDKVVKFQDLPSALVHADLVVCATGARSPLLGVSDLERVMAHRSGRPLTVVDLSLPRNVEPAARYVPGVRLLDLDDLVIDSTALQVRRREQIVSEELERYQSWRAGRAIGHLLARLHHTVERACRATIEASWTEAAGSSELLAETARRSANKLLHQPTLTIKHLIATGDEVSALAVLASFGVTPEPVSSLPGMQIPMKQAS